MTRASIGRILIVDDNEMNRDMLARRLGAKGYEVDVAASAENLLQRVQEWAPEIILLDVEMPGISGLDALQSLRRTYAPGRLPVIMVTARDQSHQIVEALDFGANDYVTKPIDFPVALARVRTHLAHKRTGEALRQSEERYALAALGANDGLWDWDLTNNIIYLSPRWKSMLGYHESEIGNHPDEWFNRIHAADRDRVRRELAAHQFSGSAPLHTECRIQHKDDNFRWVLTRGVAVHDAAGRPLRMAGSQTDITATRAADALTGLPNRLLFLDRLERLIEHRKRHPRDLFGVLFLDLDGFKTINDSLGHSTGDHLLIAVAERLGSCLRASDTVTRLDHGFTLARLGGDEFTILLDEIEGPANAAKIGERLLLALAQPFHLEGREIFTSASLGIALSRGGFESPEDLLRDADTAMYQAKARGKGLCEIFTLEMRAQVVARLQLEMDLRAALERREFRNVYQPIVQLDTGRIVGFEALLRWQHPSRGLLQPIEFIPLAEETGMIRELGLWNLREACLQVSLWNRERNGSPLIMSVNLSVIQFLQSDLVGALEGLLRELQFPPEWLALEITESSVMAEPVVAVATLQRIRALGVKLAADDFGTGYSSLSYLHQFPLDTLKIDRSFTRSIGPAGDRAEIVGSILPLAKTLQLNVIAEGIETAEQLQILRELECAYGQGFYFAKPLAAAEAEALLATNPRW